MNTSRIKFWMPWLIALAMVLAFAALFVQSTPASQPGHWVVVGTFSGEMGLCAGHPTCPHSDNIVEKVPEGATHVDVTVLWKQTGDPAGQSNQGSYVSSLNHEEYGWVPDIRGAVDGPKTLLDKAEIEGKNLKIKGVHQDRSNPSPQSPGSHKVVVSGKFFRWVLDPTTTPEPPKATSTVTATPTATKTSTASATNVPSPTATIVPPTGTITATSTLEPRPSETPPSPVPSQTPTPVGDIDEPVVETAQPTPSSTPLPSQTPPAPTKTLEPRVPRACAWLQGTGFVFSGKMNKESTKIDSIRYRNLAGNWLAFHEVTSAGDGSFRFELAEFAQELIVKVGKTTCSWFYVPQPSGPTRTPAAPTPEVEAPQAELAVAIVDQQECPPTGICCPCSAEMTSLLVANYQVLTDLGNQMLAAGSYPHDQMTIFVAVPPTWCTSPEVEESYTAYLHTRLKVLAMAK